MFFDITFLTIFSIAINIVLLILVGFKGDGNGRKSLLWLLTFVSTWQIFGLLSNYTLEEQLAAFFMKLDYSAALLASSSLLIFIQDFTHASVKRNSKLRNYLIVVSVVICLFVLFTDLVVHSVKLGESISIVHGGALEGVYFAIILLLFIASLIRIFLEAKYIKNKIILVGMVSTAFIAIVTQIVFLPIFQEYDLSSGFVYKVLPEIGRVSVLVTAISLSYSIMRSRLFGFEILLTKILFWFITISGVSLFFLGIFLLEVWLLGSISTLGTILSNILLAFFLALLFSVYEKRIRELIRKYLMKVTFDPESLLEQFNLWLRQTNELEEVVDAAFDIVHKSFAPNKQGVLFNLNEDGEGEMFSRWANFSEDEINKMEQEEVVNEILHKISDQQAYTILSLKEVGLSEKTLDVLKSLDVALVLPLRKNNMYGFYVFSYGTSGKDYEDPVFAFLEKFGQALSTHFATTPYNRE